MPTTIDGRNMVPPEPLERTLAALDELVPGDEFVLFVNCQPRPLYRALQRSGFTWREIAHDDGSFEIRISHESPPCPASSV